MIGKLGFSAGRTHAWIRFGDHGLRVVDHRQHPIFYRERSGHTGQRYWHIGPWCVATVAPLPRFRSVQLDAAMPVLNRAGWRSADVRRALARNVGHLTDRPDSRA